MHTHVFVNFAAALLLTASSLPLWAKSDAAVQACRSQPGIEKDHRLLNCLAAALRRAGP